MSQNGTNMIEIFSSPSPPSTRRVKKEISGAFGQSLTVVPLSSPSSSSEKTTSTDTPIRHIVCLKNAGDLKRFEETEDCFILDFNPIEPLNLVSLFNDDTEDISVVAEKGQVACRDYPHSRHLCLKFPFDETPHESHCDMCYCYVCDSPAPCSKWKDSVAPHCNASENISHWKLMRTLIRQI